MLFFTHLTLGLLLGIGLWYLVQDKRAVLLAGLGAILPDLLDKPLGLILLQETVNYSRVIFHGLFVLVIFLLLGILLWRIRHNPILLSLGAGGLAHQLLDQMWELPEIWLYPFLGPLWRRYQEDYFLNVFWREVGSPLEWVMGILMVGLLYWVMTRPSGYWEGSAGRKD